MRIKVFNGHLSSIEETINSFLETNSVTVKFATQSINIESPLDTVLTITIFYE